MSEIFKFLSSIRLTLILLILIIILSIIGSLIPQEQELSFYQNSLPRLAGLITFLGFDHLYRSPLFLSLVFLFLLNLLFCSIKQFRVKLKRLSRPAEFMPSLEMETEKPGLKLPKNFKFDQELLFSALKKNKYKIKQLKENEHLLILARKGVAGLFGPEIVHLGLIIIILGGLISALFSYRTTLALIEGETAEIPGKNFSLRLDKFTTEYYPDGSIKDWKSTVSIIKNDRVNTQAVIEVNHPFSYGGLSFYQMSYGQDWDRASVELELKIGEKPATTITLKSGESTRTADGLSLKLLSFVPDFQISSNGQVSSRSPEPQNPAALVEIKNADQTIFSGWIFYLAKNLTHFQRKAWPEIEVNLKNFSAPQFSVLEASSDPGSQSVWLGSGLLILGLFFSFYFPYKELKLLIDSNGQIKIFPYAKKNRQDFLNEIGVLLENLNKKQN